MYKVRLILGVKNSSHDTLMRSEYFFYPQLLSSMHPHAQLKLNQDACWNFFPPSHSFLVINNAFEYLADCQAVCIMCFIKVMPAFELGKVKKMLAACPDWIDMYN